MERIEPCGKRHPYVIDYALVPEPDSDRRLLVGLDSCGHVWVSLTDALRNSGLTDAPPTYRATVIAHTGRAGLLAYRSDVRRWIDHTPGCVALVGVNASPVVYPWPEGVAA